jgi:hypothetical protein
VIHIIAVAGLLAIEHLRWVDPIAHRTGAVAFSSLVTWLESHENPLIFVGQGVWMARLRVVRDESGAPTVVAVRRGHLDENPFAELPRFQAIHEPPTGLDSQPVPQSTDIRPGRSFS